MKQQLNLRSMLIGIVGTVAVVTAFSFKNNSNGNEGRFQTTVGESGVVIIDSQNGDYIINTDCTNRGWRKGNFSDTHTRSR